MFQNFEYQVMDVLRNEKSWLECRNLEIRRN